MAKDESEMVLESISVSLKQEFCSSIELIIILI